MNLKSLLFILLVSSFTYAGLGQEEVSEEGTMTAEETVVVEGAPVNQSDSAASKREKPYRNFGDTTVEQHSYKKALWLSAVLPGLGQVYNSIGHPYGKNRYWKIPIIYAGLGAMVYFIIDNQNKRNKYIEEYDYRYVDQQNDFLYDEFKNLDSLALITEVDDHTFYRDLSIFGLVVVYALNIVDAAVDAHFYNFSLGKKLDMSWQPFASPVNSAMGLTLNFNFKVPNNGLSLRRLGSPF